MIDQHGIDQWATVDRDCFSGRAGPTYGACLDGGRVPSDRLRNEADRSLTVVCHDREGRDCGRRLAVQCSFRRPTAAASRSCDRRERDQNDGDKSESWSPTCPPGFREGPTRWLQDLAEMAARWRRGLSGGDPGAVELALLSPFFCRALQRVVVEGAESVIDPFGEIVAAIGARAVGLVFVIANEIATGNFDLRQRVQRSAGTKRVSGLRPQCRKTPRTSKDGPTTS